MRLDRPADNIASLLHHAEVVRQQADAARDTANAGGVLMMHHRRRARLLEALADEYADAAADLESRAIAKTQGYVA